MDRKSGSPEHGLKAAEEACKVADEAEEAAEVAKEALVKAQAALAAARAAHSAMEVAGICTGEGVAMKAIQASSAVVQVGFGFSDLHACMHACCIWCCCERPADHCTAASE